MTWFAQHAWLFPFGARAFAVLVILVLTLVALRVIRAFRARVERRLVAQKPRDADAAEHRQRIETVLRVGGDIARIAVLLAAGIALLGQLGVSIQPFVAGAGLIGAAIALGSQTIVRDFVSGFFILLEGHFVIGDDVQVGSGLSGVVEKMSLRVTILRDAEGAVHIVPNGTIGTVTNRSYHWSSAVLDIGVDIAADAEQVRSALQQAATSVENEVLLDRPSVEGPIALKGSKVVWRISARTMPDGAHVARTQLITATAQSLRAHGIALKD
jgi:moderate conductance mechanosensitive channel